MRGLRLGAEVTSALILIPILAVDLFLIFNLIILPLPFLFNSFYPLSILFSSVLLVKRGSSRRSSATRMNVEYKIRFNAFYTVLSSILILLSKVVLHLPIYYGLV